MSRNTGRTLVALVACTLISQAADSVQTTGELRQWHRVTLTFQGPKTAENATDNPFRNLRLDLEFHHAASGSKYTVPGYFAADGNAGESSASEGDRWRVHFSPDSVGLWTWRARFLSGPDIAVQDEPVKGIPVLPVNGMTGKFEVLPGDKKAPDFRARGTLEYVGERYLRFAGDGTYFLKGGVDSPETLLGYADFDGTFRDVSTENRPKALAGIVQLPSLKDGLHRYEPHLRDWKEGDPSWKDGRGKGLIGGLNYLASQGVNSAYFLTMNVNGDGRNVWPWTEPWTRDRFDCSKLDQWEIVFSHMTRLGIMLHVVLQETENDALLDGGMVGPERRLYIRELMARFAHHPAITWNLGEENVQTVAQQKAFAQLVRDTDPYRHHIVIHNDHWHAKNIRETFDPLLGFPALTGTALQDFFWNDIHSHVKHYVRASARAGHQWVVGADELGGANFGTLSDAEDADHDMPRRFGLWATLMAGGAGVEWYFGWQNNSPHSDLSAEDWRTREGMYRQTRLAIEFMNAHLPFAKMQPVDDIAVGHGVYTFADPGNVYALYLPHGGSTRFDLGKRTGRYEVKWFDPRNGGPLRDGSVKYVRGPGLAWTGTPPADAMKDWVALIRRVPETAPPRSVFPTTDWRKAPPEEMGVDPVALQKALDLWRSALGDHGVDHVVVVRRGVLIHEGKGARIPFDLRSATKSFTSTLLGVLSAEKNIPIDSAAANYEPLLKELYPGVTLRHFATMTSGYNAPGDSRWGDQSADWSPTPYVPGKPLFAPGTQFTYWDEAQMMFGRVLTQLARRDLLHVLNEQVLSKIGAPAQNWTAEGSIGDVPIRNGCTGLSLNALQLARFGHLFLNMGDWNGARVLSAEWVREATKPQIGDSVVPADTDRRGDGRGRYGLNWWVNGRLPGGDLVMPDSPAGAYFAAGRNHNICLVIPEWEMVLVRLGADSQPLGGHAGVLNSVMRKLGQGVYPLE